MGRISRLRVVRGLFVVLVLVAGVVAIAHQQDEVRQALRDLPAGLVVTSLVVGMLYMLVTMLVWRAVLHDLGSPLTIGVAGRLFFVSQLGKYLPGGVWNIVAVTEMGLDHQIPRRRSLSAMLVSTLISVGTGLALAAAAVPFAPSAMAERFEWVFWLSPLFVAGLLPPVLNRLLDGTLRLLRRPPLEHAISAGGVLTAVSWSLLAWLLVGVHVWLLGTGVGLDGSPSTIAMATGAYALAWTAGFLVLVVPAGLGVRETVLAASLASQLDAGAIVVVVVLSRALLTLVDLLLGATALVATRKSIGTS